jgi:hypothetical protein
LENFGPKLWEILNFEWFFVIENSIKLQKMVLEGKICWSTSSHSGQLHRLNKYVYMGRTLCVYVCHCFKNELTMTLKTLWASLMWPKLLGIDWWHWVDPGFEEKIWSYFNFQHGSSNSQTFDYDIFHKNFKPIHIQNE